MSEPVMSAVTTAMEPGSPVQTQPPSAGALLRQARQTAGVELTALAAALKVSVKKLDDLEADRLDQFPDAVFVRALAASVCRALKVDAAAVLALLPQTTPPRLTHDDHSLNAPFRSPADAGRVQRLHRLSRPMVLVALVALLAALILILLPGLESRSQEGGVISLGGQAVLSALESVPSTSSAQPQQPAVELASPQPVITPAVSEISQTKPTKLELSSEPKPEHQSPAAAEIVVFKTREPSWIEVMDAKGDMALSRHLAAGERVGVAGALPLKVIVGRAEATEVLVRGQPFELQTVSKLGVARFEVK